MLGQIVFWNQKLRQGIFIFRQVFQHETRKKNGRAAFLDAMKAYDNVWMKVNGDKCRNILSGNFLEVLNLEFCFSSDVCHIVSDL